MKKLLGKRAKLGALSAIAILLLGSAAIRVAIHAGPAVAKSMGEKEVQQDMEASHDAKDDNHGTEKDDSRMANAGTAAGMPSAESLRLLMEELQAREARLAAEEERVMTRARSLEIAEQAVRMKVEELNEAEARLRETLALADGAAEGDLSKLTSVYEKMKPKDAAALFEEMDPRFAAGFLGRMKPNVAAGILAKLSPQAAYTISVILAGRNAEVPKE